MITNATLTYYATYGYDYNDIIFIIIILFVYVSFMTVNVSYVTVIYVAVIS